MPLALSTCVLFILFTQSVNGAQFLDITVLSVLFVLFPPVFHTVVVPLTSMYALL